MSDKKQTKSVLSQSTALTSGSAMALGALMAKDSQSRRKRSVGKEKDLKDTASSVEGTSTVPEPASTAPKPAVPAAPIAEPAPTTEQGTRSQNASDGMEDKSASRKKPPGATKSVLSQSPDLKSGSAMALASLMAKDSQKRGPKAGERREPQNVDSTSTALPELNEQDEIEDNEQGAPLARPVEPTNQSTIVANTTKSASKPDMTKSVLSQSSTLKSGNAMVLGSLVASGAARRKGGNDQPSSDIQSVALSDVTSQQIAHAQLDSIAEARLDDRDDPHGFEHYPAIPNDVEHSNEPESSIWIPLPLSYPSDTDQSSYVAPSPQPKVDWGPKENYPVGPHRNLIEIGSSKALVTVDDKHVLHQSNGASAREKICSWKCCSRTDDFEVELYSKPKHAVGPKHEAAPAHSSLLQRYCEEPAHTGFFKLRECTDELGQEVFLA